MTFQKANLGIGFATFIADRTTNFIGRKWVFDAIHSCLTETKGKRLFLLTGEPGSGKTAIAARLTQFSQSETSLHPDFAPGFLSAFHFCSARDSTSVDPKNFSRSIALQLAQIIPEYAQALKDIGEKSVNIEVEIEVETTEGNTTIQGVVIKNLSVAGLTGQEAFNRAVLDPLTTLYNQGFDRPITILVDSLDEALPHSGDVTIIDLLSKLPPQIKARWILTSRQESRVENAFVLEGVDSLFLSAPEFNQNNRQDIQAYIKKRLTQEVSLAAQVSGLNPSQRTDQIAQITDKSDGNFQYVNFLLDAIANGKRSLTDLEGLPEGLDGLYYDSLQRVVNLGKKDWSTVYASVLGVLSVAQEGLTLSQLQAFSGHSEQTVWDCFNDLQQFLNETIPSSDQEEVENQYRFYHQSVVDFLQKRSLIINQKKLNNLYYLSPRDWHQRIADYYWNRYHLHWSQCDRYGLTKVPVHLAKAAKCAGNEYEAKRFTDKLRQLLLTFDWLQSKVKGISIYSLEVDYSFLPGDQTIELLREALELSSHVLVKDGDQLSNQLRGRLMYIEDSDIQELLRQSIPQTNSPWLSFIRSSFTAPGGRLIRTLTGHKGDVRTITVTRDGKRVISGAGRGDDTLKVWDLETGKELFSLKGHSKPIKSVITTPDGTKIISASDDNTLIVWSSQTGEQIFTLNGHRCPVKDVAATPDSKRAISASEDRKLKLWDLTTGSELLTMNGHSERVEAVAITSDGMKAVSGSGDSTLRVWDLKTGQELLILSGHQGAVRSVAIAPDDKRVVSASSDRNLKVWDLKTGQEIFTLIGHRQQVQGLSITPDGNQAVSGSFDKTIKVWDLKTGKEVIGWNTDHTSQILSISITPDGKNILSSSLDTTIKIWQLRSDQQDRSVFGHSSKVERVKFSVNADNLVSCSSDGKIKIWNIQVGNIPFTVKDVSSSSIECVDIGLDSKMVVLGRRDRNIEVINRKDVDQENDGIQRLKLSTKKKGRISFVTLSPIEVSSTMKPVVGCSSNGDLEIFKLNINSQDLDCQESIRLQTGGVPVTALNIFPNSRRLILGLQDGFVRIYDVKKGKKVEHIRLNKLPITALSVSLSEQLLISGFTDGSIHGWDLNLGLKNEVIKLIGHTASICSIAITPNEKRAISVSRDKSLRVWDLVNKKNLVTLAFDSTPTTCDVGADNLTIAVGESSGRLHLLRLEGVLQI